VIGVFVAGGTRIRPDERDCRNLIGEAKRRGASNAKVILTRDIVLDKRVRLKCSVPVCSSYGTHLMCPPNVMPVDEFREVLSMYKKALIIQIEADYNSSDRSPRKELSKELEDVITETDVLMKKLHLIVNAMETMAFKKGFHLATGLIGGQCMLCSECIPPSSGKACRHPFEARPSMEAMGIDVVRTCERVGLKVSLSSKEPVRWTGLVLLD
jgi:predicted metal-binding protein